MEFIRQSIPDVVCIQPLIHSDSRGYFFEAFKKREFENFLGYRVDFCQVNESKSAEGVLRGLHYQAPPYAQSKLVRVIEGVVLDVAVDIRHNSPTFGQHVTIKLSGENKKQLFVPKGFAHGFLVLSDYAIFTYKVDNDYAPQSEFGIIYDDPEIDIDWSFPESNITLSHKDQHNPTLNQLEKHFDYLENYYE